MSDITITSALLQDKPHSINVILPSGTIILSNRPLEAVLSRFSGITPEIAEKISPVVTGGYDPRLLDSVDDLVYEVFISKIPRVADENVDEVAALRTRARASSFAFVEGESVTTVWAQYKGHNVDSWEQFCDILGVRVTNSVKISKRLKELVRRTPFFARLSKVSVATFEAVHPELAQTDVDGISGIRMSLALKLAPNAAVRKMIHDGKICRVMFRCITPQGLIKGDAIIRPNDALPADIYTSVHNIKSELASTRDYIVSMEPHSNHGPVHSDEQTMSWFKGLFPIDQLTLAVNETLRETYDSITRGEYPYYMTHIPHSDTIDGITINQTLAQKWQAHGMEITHSAAMIKMAGTAVRNHLLPAAPVIKTSNGYRPDPSRQRVRIPMLWAFGAHVCTDVAMRLLGIVIPGEYEGKLWYCAEAGTIVIPATHFGDFYAEHGGWDQDDRVEILIRAIDGESVRAILIRRPNSWGEYSTLPAVIETLPLYNKFGDIPTLERSSMPEQISDLIFDDPNIDRSIPSDNFERGAKYSILDFDYALDCALLNPGTGAAINLMCIAYNAIFGTYDRNPWANTEDIVDLTQQNPNVIGLSALSDALARYQELLIAKLAEGTAVDPAIYARRLNLSGDQKADLNGLVVLEEQIFSASIKMVKEAIKHYMVQLNNLAISIRIKLDFSDINMRRYNEAVDELWGLYTSSTALAGRAYDPRMIRNIWQNLNRLIVTMFNATSPWNNDELAAVIRNCGFLPKDRLVNVARRLAVTPQPIKDEIIFAVMQRIYDRQKTDTILFLTPGTKGGVIETSTMDLYLAALIRRGIAFE